MNWAKTGSSESLVFVILTSRQTNKQTDHVAFWNRLEKFCDSQNIGNLRKKNLMLRNLFLSQKDLSWSKTETKLKERCGRWKTFSKGMVHGMIGPITVNLVWNACVAQNFSTWLCLPVCWIYERSSRRWNLMSLSSSGPSGANSALPPISGNNAFLPRPDLCNDLNYFCS